MVEDKSDIEELKEFLAEKKDLEPKEATVINDKTQFSIRIPRMFVRMFNLKGGEKFEFKPIMDEKGLVLTGRLKDGMDKK